MGLTIQKIMKDTHALARKNGFWDEGEARNKGEMLALIHSEVSEALEALRKHKKDDHLPEFDGEVVELADAIIRICDYAAGFGLPLEAAIVAKHEFNKSRPYKHGKKF